MLSLLNVTSPPRLVRPIGVHVGEVMYFGSFCLGGELGFLNCNDVCMCVVNKQFELIEFVFNSVMFIFYCWLCVLVCRHVVILGLSVRLSWYPMWWLR